MVAAKKAVSAADDGDGGHGGGRVQEQNVRAGDHVDARGHHGRRVDQRADWRGAFHGVRQPDVERNLRRLACGAGKQQQRDRGQHAVAAVSTGIAEAL